MIWLDDFVKDMDARIDADIHRLMHPLVLGTPEKTLLLKVVRVTLEHYFSGIEPPKANAFKHNFPALEYVNDKGRISVSLYAKGRLCGCYLVKIKPKEHLINATIRASLRSVKDDRFKSRFTQEDVNDAYVDIHILSAPIHIKERTLKALYRDIELGIDALSIVQGQKRAFFKNSVPIDHGYTLKITLERLAKKAGLPKDAYKQAHTTLYRYRSLQFAAPLTEHVLSAPARAMYRAHPVIRQSDLTREVLEHSLKLSGDYLIRHIDAKGRFTYRYDPKKDKCHYSTAPAAVLRGAATAWILGALGHQLKRPDYGLGVKKHIEYLTSEFFQKDPQHQYGYFEVKSKISLGLAGFVLLSVLTLPDEHIDKTLVDDLAAFIFAAHANEKGCFYPTYPFDDRDIDSDKQLYYPGEAMTALMALYKKTGNERCVTVLTQVFAFYRALFNRHKDRLNMAAWMSKPYAELFLLTKEDRFSNFVFEINDFVAFKQRGMDQKHFDVIGGFTTVGKYCASGVLLESLAEGLRIAKAVKDVPRVEVYSRALMKGLRFLMQGQYWPDFATTLPNPSQALGGFRVDLFNADVRIDNVQHCACAVMNALNYLDIGY